MKFLKIISSAILMIGLFSPLAKATDFWNAENLHNNIECLLELTRAHKNSSQTSPAPQLKIESETPLSDFQDAMEKFWGFRPSAYINSYDYTTNTIYLSNNMSTLYKGDRTPVDSLVHELTHFVQVQDEKSKHDDADELEADAVKVQTWFRENRAQYIQNQNYQGPCK